MIRILLIALLIIFPLGQLGRFPLPLPGLVIQLNDLAVAVVVAIWFVGRIFGRTKFHWPVLTKPILAFILVAIFSLLVNLPNFKTREIFVASLYLWRWIAYAGLYFLIWDLLGKEKNVSVKIQRITTLMFGAGVAVAILGLGQYFLYPNLRNLVYLGWDPHYFRVFGTFFDPNFTGIILVLTLILGLVKLTTSPLSPKDKWNVLLGLLLVFIALTLTFSRSTYLSLIMGLATLVIVRRNRRFLGIASFLVGILILVTLLRVIFYAPTLPERIASGKARVSSWQQSVTIIRDHPVFGVGFNTYRFVQNRYGFLGSQDWSLTHAGGGTDSSLLFVWATTGIIGLLVYLWFWGKVFQLAVSNYQLSINLVLLVSLVAVFTQSLFVNSLFYPWVMEWIWIIVGLTQVGIKDYR